MQLLNKLDVTMTAFSWSLYSFYSGPFFYQYPIRESTGLQTRVKSFFFAILRVSPSKS